MKAPRTASSADGALRFVPIDSSLLGQPLRICVAVRAPADSEPSLVLLRSAPDARVYLGAQVDADDVVREWLEIWVQTVAGLDGSAAVQRDRLSNLLLDQKWVAAANLWSEAEPAAFLATGWEDNVPRPSFVDALNLAIVHPCDPTTGAELKLCVDSSALLRAGLPAYEGSLHRYWAVLPHAAGEPVFYAATAGAPITAAVREHPMLSRDAAEFLPLNPEGGRLLVRRHPPIAFEDYLDLLGGKAWRGTVAGAGGVRFGGSYDALSDWDRLLQGADHLFLGGRGRAGRFVETFVLRLNAIYAMVKLVSQAAAQRQLPLLNVTADSFRFEIGPPAPGLPLLWTARPVLVSPGLSIALPVKTTGERYFLPLESPATSIFRPESVGLPTRGRGTVRLRRTVTDSADLTSIEGTLVTAERLGLSPHDLLWIKLPLATGIVDLFARADASEGLARGESRFRTVPHRMEPTIVAALRGAEGNTFNGTEYESIPMLSTPCDLHALGVLAVRALLVNSGNSLGVALDETLSLARELSQVAVESQRFGTAAADLAGEDPRWLDSLGPQRLSYEPIAPEAAFALLPQELWWETVATVARLFPGNGSVGYCRDFADVSSGAIEKVFDRPLADLDALLIRARGLLISDWNANREIAAAIERIR